MPLVVDANVAIKWIVKEDLHLQARRLIEDWDEEIHAPDLLFVEATNVVWRKWREGRMSRPQADEGLAKIRECFDAVHASATLLQRASTLTFEINHPVHDCFYIACAEATNSLLVTADRRLHAAAERAGLGHRVRHLADIPS
jgi:predicted nucleic acid-binding protein